MTLSYDCKPMADDIMWLAYKKSGPNILVPWWLMSALAYEYQDDPILSDKAFDQMSAILSVEWSKVKHHHKKLIDGRQVAYTGSANKKPWRNMPWRIFGAIDAIRLQLEKLNDENDDSWLD